MSEGEAESRFASIYVQQMNVRSFRGLRDCLIDFEPDLTVIVGRNNSGKSRLLRAMAIALGAAPSDRDDLTVGGSDTATIDVVLAPRASGAVGEIFGARTTRRLGSIQALTDDPPRERFAWRSTIRPSEEGLGVRTDRALLLFDQASQVWREQANQESPSFDQRSIVAADLVETRRDLVDELARRGSPIRRILDDLEIAPERRAELEVGLEGLGNEIVSSSESLAAVRAALEVLSRSVDSMGTPSIQPLPVRLEEVARSVSIDLNTGEGGLPLRFHGSGARSLTSLQVQSVLYDRRLGRDGPALRPHPVTLIEEPESHLHPHAQFELPALLEQIRGQTVVSSHSAHLVSVVDPRSIRVVRAFPSGPAIVDLRPSETDDDTVLRARRPSMHLEEMEKIRRLIERPFGELIFASGVILGDGATERALLPPLVRHVLQNRAHGLSVVDPGSLGSEHASAVVKFANLIGLPWVLFSDSDPSGVMAARKLVSDHGDGDESRIIWVPSPPAGSGKRGEATERMFLDFDSELCAAACSPLGFDASQSLLDFMVKKKGAVGRLLAAELIVRHPWAAGDGEECWPSALHALIAKLDEVLPRTDLRS